MSDLVGLTALSDSIRRIGLSDSLEQLLDTVLEQAQQLIGFDHSALMLLDPETGSLRVRCVRGYGDRAAEILTLSLARGEGISGWAAEHRQAVRVNDVDRDPRYVAGLEQCRANLAVPLIVANEVAGVINVESEHRNAFTEAHEKLLTVLASQAALAILAVRARGRLHHRIDQLDALYRISQLASGQGDLDETLQAILQVAEELMPEDHVAILLIGETGKSLVVRAARGYPRDVDLLRIPIGKGITGRCAATGKVVLAHDLDLEADYIPGVEGARSEIALPLKVEGRVIGVLNAETSTSKAYSEDHVGPLRVIAQQAAVVIRSAQLNDEARRLAITDPLTGLYNRRYFVDKLEEQLRRARRYGDRLSLVLVDADHFKSINDEHGHLSGDRALKAVADVMVSTLRDTDELARIGGDEFAALLLDAGEERTTAVTERLRQHVQRLALMSDDGKRIPLTVSAGIAFYPQHGIDGKALLRQADQALYRAKSEGRNQLTVAPNPGSAPTDASTP